MNITGNLFDHLALQNPSGCGYGEHHHININTPEDKPIGLGALDTENIITLTSTGQRINPLDLGLWIRRTSSH
jgi:hypothetical protein